MHTPDTAFEAFRVLFPYTRLNQLEDEMRYTFYSGTDVMKAEDDADRLIFKEGLPLTSEVQTWSKKGEVFEIALVIKTAPEPYAFDEVPDEDGMPNYWGIGVRE